MRTEFVAHPSRRGLRPLLRMSLFVKPDSKEASKPAATRSVPFSITLLTLMGLIVVPLASALLWLGWHAVDVLEQRSVNQRMSALDYAVSTTLTDGLRTISSVGLTLAESPR